MKKLLLIMILSAAFCGLAVRCDYEGALVEYPEQVEKPAGDTSATQEGKE